MVVQTEAASGPRTFFVSLRVKLILAFALLFLALFAGIFWWFYTFSSQRAVDRLSEDLSVLIEGAAARIDGDDLQGLIDDGNFEDIGDDPRYVQQVEWLEAIKEIDPRATTYTMTQGDEPNELMMLVVATQRSAPDESAKFGETFIAEDVPPEFNELFEGSRDQYILLEPYQDDFGSWISGYQVIRDNSGDVVAVVGADFKADYYYQIQSDVQSIALRASLLSSALVVGAVWLIATLLTRPIEALRQRTRLIAEGQYNQDFSQLLGGMFRDEIGALAGVFAIMVDKVKTREDNLKKEVAELKIEIDLAKREAQVAEVVDSDFFQDLRAKAGAIRSRHHKSEVTSGTPNDGEQKLSS